MAKNTKSQKIGRRGETTAWKIFEDLGYVCNDIPNDFGEDFFVLGEQDEIIEPFKIFIQVKASEEYEKNPSDWTEYCDPFTVRNWILSNELTVVIRTNLRSDESRYHVPEDECEYWTIDYTKNVPIRLETKFDHVAAQHLIWMARIRHYDRLVKLTVPNKFEAHYFEEIPRYRLFVLELLSRLNIIDASGILDPAFLACYKEIFEDTATQIEEDAPDMTRHELIRYATCFQTIPLALYGVSKMKVGISPTLTDHCACVLVQFVIAAEDEGMLPITTQCA